MSESAVEVATEVGPLLLPSWDRVIAPVMQRDHIWEPGETRFLRRTLRAGQTFVDVGAHVGYFTVLASKRVGEEGRVYAVEPEERNRELLRLNLERNECGNVVVLPYAAAATSGDATLELDEENSGRHRLLPVGGTGACVECVRLDDVIPVAPDVVKVDAQGYDHEALEGFERRLAENPRVFVVVELSLSELTIRGIEPAAVLDGYVGGGFAISTLDERGQLRRSSVDDVLSGCRDGRFPSDFSIVLDRPPVASGEFPRRNDRLEATETPDGLRVYDPERDRLHTLNLTASIVFDLCTGANSVAAIVERVQSAFDLPEPPIAEVEQCLAHLRAERLVA